MMLAHPKEWLGECSLAGATSRMRASLGARSIAVAVLGVAVFSAAMACGGDSSSHDLSGMDHGAGGMMGAAAPAGSITVDLSNWAVTSAETSAKAGSVTFYAVHDMGHMHSAAEGGVTHDLQVMRKNSDGSLTMAGQVQGLTMGEAQALTLNLSPGEYELSCNVVEQVNGKMVSHYANGMHESFEVTS